MDAVRDAGNFRDIPTIPYGCTIHGEEEIAAVVKVLRTSTQMGQHVAEFEAKIAGIFAKRLGLMVNSGTSANYLAIEILNLPERSEVITPVLTFATTVAPLIKNKLIPAFVDVEPQTFNIAIDQITSLITSKTRAMLVPNLLGNLPNWVKLREIAHRHNLILIEDSADTLGGYFAGKPTGYYSDISTTSFYGSHIINCAGNGGMVLVNDEHLAQQIKLLRSWGRSSSLYENSESINQRFSTKLDDIAYDAKFIFETIGYNLEPSELGAAFGLIQLKKLATNIALRKIHFNEHKRFFSNYQEFFILPTELAGTDTAWLAFPLIVKDSAPFNRTELQIYLEQHGIQTRTVFTGNILRQPGFARIKRKEISDGYPNADLVMRGGLLIGCHHGLDTHTLSYIYSVFFDFLTKR